MKMKWAYPFLPWLAVFWDAALETRHGWSTPIEHKVLVVITATLLCAILLGIIQPWREDSTDG